jgi:hypothetical protein
MISGVGLLVKISPKLYPLVGGQQAADTLAPREVMTSKLNSASTVLVVSSLSCTSTISPNACDSLPSPASLPAAVRVPMSVFISASNEISTLP